MIDKRATVVILVLASAAACGGWWLQRHLLAPAQTPRSAPAIEAAPSSRPSIPVDLVLPDLDGRPQRLSQWRGQRVLLNFWATWCAPCRKEMPELSAAQKKHPQVRIVGVAMDQPQAVREYLKQTPVDYSMLIGIDASPDPSQQFGDNVGALPYSVLIGVDGRVLRSKLGPFDTGELEHWLGP
ncbi:MAG: redoxin family protein [Proteobacteria bacterium]|nr:redoxin family protein [Pseudomonadota bacterium]